MAFDPHTLHFANGGRIDDQTAEGREYLSRLDGDQTMLDIAASISFAAEGGKVGNSLCERDKFDVARAAKAKAQAKGVKLLLPTDNLVVEKL